MDLRALLLTGLLLTVGAAVVAPTANAACVSGTTVDCDAKVGNCDTTLDANVVTSTYALATADCRGGGIGTRCYTAVGVGGDLTDPTVERWCVF